MGSLCTKFHEDRSKESRYGPVIIFSVCIPVTLTSDLFTLKAKGDFPVSCGVCVPSFKIEVKGTQLCAGDHFW